MFLTRDTKNQSALINSARSSSAMDASNHGWKPQWKTSLAYH
jgi:hypothetical protein